MDSLKIDEIISKLSDNKLDFLKTQFLPIKSLTFPWPGNSSSEDNKFQFELIPNSLSKDLEKNINIFLKTLTIESLTKDLEKHSKKIQAIQKRNNETKAVEPPFLVKVSSVLSDGESNTNIQEIVFSAYKISITSEILINEISKIIKSELKKTSETETEALSDKNLKSAKIEENDLLYYVILHLENNILTEYSKKINIESLDFLNNNYAIETDESKTADSKAKKNKNAKNTKHKNPYLQNFIYSCNIKGKFLGAEFNVAGKLENSKVSFAAEFEFDLKDQSNINMAQLTSDFKFDVIEWPKVEIAAKDNLEVKLYYSNNAFYGILNYGAYQLHLGLGKKKFLITSIDFSKDKEGDSSLLKDVFGINKVFLLIQNEGAISENHHLLAELKEAFNIEEFEDEDDEDSTPKEEDESKDKKESDKEDSEKKDHDNKEEQSKETKGPAKEDNKIQETPFDSGKNKDISKSKFAIATEIVKNSSKDGENKDNLITPILDFIGAEKIAFYGIIGKDLKQFGLYIDQIGNTDRPKGEEKFFSLKNFKIDYQNYKGEHRFKGATDLCFKFEKDEFELGIRALISKREISFGGILKKDIHFNDRLILKQAAVNIGYKNATKTTTFGLAGMIEGQGLKKKTFNLQGAASFGVLASTVRPVLLSAAVTSDKDGVNIADFIYSVSSIDLSFVPTFTMVNIEDLELYKNGVNIPKNLTKTGKDEEDALEAAESELITSFNKVNTIKGFQIDGDYSITPLGTTSNYIVTDNQKMIHYKVTHAGGINLISQFYLCTEETTIGDNTYKPGLFVAGKITFLGVSSKFLFQVIKGDSPQESSLTAAISISRVNILGGLLCLEKQETPVNSTLDLQKNAPGSLQLFTQDDKKEVGPVMYCHYAGTPESLVLYLNARLSVFWGLLVFGADIKVIENKVEVFMEAKFGIFKANITYRADLFNLKNGQFYLKLDLEVLSLNKAIKELADKTRKAGEDANKELEKAKNDLKSKFDSRHQISVRIDKTKKEISDTSWLRVGKLAKLGIELLAYYAEYGVITVAIGLLEAAVAVLQAAITATTQVIGAVLDAAAWVVEQLGKVFSIDSLLLEIDYSNGANNSGKQVKFKAAADYTILGYKFNPELDLNIDFNKDIFPQILDQITSNAEEIKKEIDDNQGKLPEKYIKEEDKKIDPKPTEREQRPIKPEDIKENTAKTIAYNHAVDSLYTLLIENEYVQEYLSNSVEDGDDIIYFEMLTMKEQVVYLSKDSYLNSLNNLVTDRKFNKQQEVLSTFAQTKDATPELKKAIEKMNTNVNSLSEGMEKQEEVSTERILKLKTEFQIRQEFIKHYNLFKNNQ